MQVSLQRQPIENVEAEAVILVVFEDGLEKRQEARLGLGELYHSGEIAGKPYEMTLLHNVAGLRAKRLLAVGAGKPGKFGPAEMRWVAGAAIRHLQSKSITQAALFLDPAYAGADYVAAAVEGAILGEFEPDRYKTDKKGAKKLERFTVVVAEGGPHLDAAAERGRITAEAQNFARELANGRFRPGIRGTRSRSHEPTRDGQPVGSCPGQRRAARADHPALPSR
jgi:leucyl aminopeptidase